MNTGLKRALTALQWSVGLVVLYESCMFAFSPSRAHVLDHMGLPAWFRPALAGTEAIAAILFLMPRALVVGSYALLAIFAVAAAIHMLQGQFQIGELIVFATGVLAVLAGREQQSIG